MKRMEVLSIFVTLVLAGCGGSSNSPALGNDASTRSVTPGTPPWGITVDASADKPKADAQADSPAKDVSSDSPAKADAIQLDTIALDAVKTCAIGQTCMYDSDCPNGLTCQKFNDYDGQVLTGRMCAPSKCATCTEQTCVVTEEACDFVSCRSDGGVTDAPKDAATDKPKADAATSGVDATAVDAMPPDTTPVPLDAMPPSWAASCTLAATEPCGGDITGTWNIVGDCDNWMSETEFADDYGGSCASFGDSADNGAFVFNADSTCKKDETLTYKIDFDVSCLTDHKNTCSNADKEYKSWIGAQGSENMTAGGCTLSTETNCYCERTYDYTDTFCKYSVSGMSYTMTYSDGTQGTHDYCVRGNVLSIFYSAYSSVGTAIGAKDVFVLKRAD